LIAACEQHTFARGARDPTLAACFDADRLDLTRLGAVVDPALLCTAEGRRIAAARDHALLRALPLRGT